MPISDVTPSISYVAAGEASFPFPFQVFKDTELLVTVEGVPKVLGTDYTITLLPIGGSVDFLSGKTPPESNLVDLKRQTPLQRIISYVEFGLFHEETADEDLDRLIMIQQELSLYQNVLSNRLNDFEQTYVTGAAYYANSVAAGSVPWIDDRGYPNLALADAVAAAAGKYLVISKQWDVVPSVMNASLSFVPGGKLNNVTNLQINGSFKAGEFQVFVGAGSVVFGPQATNSVLPQWWGAVGDNAHDDTSAFESAIATLQSYMEVFAPRGRTYKLTRNLNLLNMPKGSTFTCEGTLSFAGDVAGVTVNGWQVGVRIGRLYSPNSSTKEGLTLKSVRQATIWVGSIDNFATSLNLIGKYGFNGVNGVSCNSITVRDMYTVNGTCVKITTEKNDAGTTPGYVNENYFYLGTMTGLKGIVSTKGPGQTDPFNGNRFMFPQFENIGGAGSVGLELNYASMNTIIYPRFEGGSTPALWINEGADCSRNVFLLSGVLDKNKFTFGGVLTQVIGEMSDAGGDVTHQIQLGKSSAGTYDIYLANSKRSNTLNGTVYFDTSGAGTAPFQTWAGGVRDMTGADRKFGLLDPLGSQSITAQEGDQAVANSTSYLRVSSTGAASVCLVMPSSREIEGFVVLLSVPYYTQPISVKKGSSGTVVIAEGTTIASAGYYWLAYRGGTWEATKIGGKVTQANSVATTVPQLVADFNTLLAALR